MKKLFLTSGLVLCMAGQAYASTAINYDNNSYGPSGCNYTYLDTYDTSSSLEAIWESNPYTITLNSYTGTNEYGSTAASPASLYALYGDAVYLESAHTNAMSTTANGLTSVPAGKTYTLTLNTNVTTSGTGGMNAAHTDSQVTAASGTKAASTNAQMSFAGFYSAAQSSKTTTNGTQYIGTDGKITTDGITAGISISKVDGDCPSTVWHAQYTCQDEEPYTPYLTGYSFMGWYDAANDGNRVIDFCLDSDKTVYAQWFAQHFSITYDCHGGTIAVESSSPTWVIDHVEYDQLYAFKSQADLCTYQNHTPSGWSCTTNVTPVTPWYTEQNWQIAKDVVCTAQWDDTPYTVTYKNGNCHSGTETEWTDSTRTYLNGTYTIPGVNNGDITAVYSEGNDKEFIGWELDWGDGSTGDSLKNYGDSINWSHSSNLTLKAQCKDAYKLEYSCGVDPDDNSTAIGGTAPETQTVRIGDDNVVTAGAPTQCDNGLLEFDHWYCVKKDHDNASDAGVFGTDGKFGTGVSLTNSWPAYDGLCTAVWNNPVLTCPSSHQEHDEEVVTSYTQCYRIATTDSCDKRGEETATQSNCIYNTDCSCERVTYRVYANVEGNADGDVIKSEDGSEIYQSVPEPYCIRGIVAGSSPIDAVSGYKYNSQTGACEELPKYPLIYDCNNNGLGTDGNGTNPQGGEYWEGAPVTLLSYPAGCQAPAERSVDQAGWECEGVTQEQVSVGEFDMPANAVKCKARWKGTAYNITYVRCDCPGVRKQKALCDEEHPLNPKVRSGENENNDQSTYYVTYTHDRNVRFPTVVGTNYGQINVLDQAFGHTWFTFNSAGEAFSKQTAWDVDRDPVSGGITVYTCLGDSYQVTYNCIKGTGGTNVDGPYQKTTISTRGKNTCPYEPGWTFKWNCGGSYTNVNPGGSIYVNEDKTCNAEWTCDVANGYEYDSATDTCVKKHNLTFDCDNGKDSLDIRENLSIGAGVNMNTAPNCQQKKGHSASYTWSCTTSPINDVITIPDADVTCTAQWTSEKYDVIYNSGNCMDKLNTTVYTHERGATYGQNYSVPADANNAITVRQGYTFANAWNTDSGQTVGNFPGNTERPWSHEGSVTVYAVCQPIQYDLTLRCNDGINDNRTTSYNAGESVPLDSNNRNGCAADTNGRTFTGWTCDPSELYNNSTVTMNQSVICDANWDIKYELTYDCAINDESKNPSGGWYSEGVLVSVLADSDQSTCEPAPIAHTFQGWDCRPKSGGEKISKNDSNEIVMPAEDVVCTAQWQGREFTVKYDCGEGTVKSGKQNVHNGLRYGQTMFEFETAQQICEREHYNPGGWTCVNTDDSSDITDTIVYNDRRKWNRAYDVLCTTDWTPEPVTLTYNCNNNGLGTTSRPGQNPEGGTYDYGTTVPMVEGDGGCKIPATGKTFKGWNCNPDKPDDNGDITLTTDTTCSADWDDAVYHLTYDCNGGTGNPPRDEDENRVLIDRHYRDSVKIKYNDNACTKLGASFSGWLCNGNSVAQGSYYTMPANDVTCYAKWTVQNYQLKYNCNNNGKGQNPASHTYAAGTQNIQVLANNDYGTCQKPEQDSVFQGWSCHKEGDTGTRFFSGSEMPAYNVVCDGQWGDVVWNITYFGCRQGRCSSCSDLWPLDDYIDASKKSYTKTMEPPVYFPVPGGEGDGMLNDVISAASYYFNGDWNIGYNLIGKTSRGMNGNLTLCTNLRPYYNVTYECGWDGVVAPEDENNPYVSGNDVTVKAGSECGAGSREGYTFTGWSCKPEAQSAFDIDAGEKFAIEADTTCTAQWTKNEYKVTYDCTERSVKSGATMQYTVHYGDEHSVASVDDKCSYDGYTFNGWVCKKVNAGNVLGTYHCPDSLADDPSCKGSSITWAFDDDLKCDALWDANHYNVIYDKGECGAVDGVAYEDNYNPDTQSGGATTGRTYTVPDVATTSMVNAMKDGYTFKGWNTVSGETKGNWTGESPWTHGEDLIVYAACEVNKYTVTYNKGNCVRNNGDSYADTDGATYGERYDALSGAATSIYAGAGYEFKGWSTKSTQTADDFDANGDLIDEWKGANPWELTRDLDVYAVCTPMTYNVRYRNNTCGGEQGAIFNDKVEYDSNYTLLSLPIEWTTGTNNAVEHSIYVPVGYKFIGWKSLTTLMEPDYPDGYTFEPWNRTSTLDLFAECVEEDYRVTYDCDTIGNPYDSYNSCNDNDETGCRTPEDDTIYHITDTVPVPLNEANTCKKIGYHFDKWNCVADDDNHTELPISQNTNRFEMLAADARCTAQWIEDEYHVLYNCDSGTSCDNSDTTGCRTPEDNTAYHYDADVITSDNQLNEQDACVRFGYSPTLWACNGGYKTEELIPGDSFKDIRQDTTCTMQWEPHRYNIKYEAGSCSGTYKEFANALQYGAGYEIKNITDINNLIVPVGYEFVGWTDDEDNVTEDGVNYSVGTYDSWTKDEGLTLYAVCKKKIYNVCYDFTVKGGQWDTNDRREPLYEFDVDTIDAGVPLAEHDDKGEAPYYVFDGWYDNSEGTGNAVTSLPGNSLRTNPPTSSVLVEQTDRISAQWDEDGFANCDVMLYAKWKPAGKIKFNCLTGWAETHKEPEDADVLTAEGTYCEIGNCEFSLWHCGDYTGSRLDYRPYVEDEEEDYIKVLVPNTTVTCTPVKDCSNLEYNIEYRVYRNGTIQNRVIYDEQEINVNELRPNTYRPGDEPVEYPEVSWSNCEFRGWYDNKDFAGEPVTHTPALAIDEEGEDIVLYGNLVCEDDTTLCNEPGHDHWLHIGDGEYDRVCLYEKRPTSQTPAVRVSRSDKNAEPYYMMLSLDSDKKIHYGSEKKMHIVHPDGNVYNVCDKSTCPELAN